MSALKVGKYARYGSVFFNSFVRRSPSHALFHNSSQTEQGFTIFSLALSSIPTLYLDQYFAVTLLTFTKNLSYCAFTGNIYIC